MKVGSQPEGQSFKHKHTYKHTYMRNLHTHTHTHTHTHWCRLIKNIEGKCC